MTQDSKVIPLVQPRVNLEPTWPAIVRLSLTITAPTSSAALGLAAAILTSNEPWDGYVYCRDAVVQVTGVVQTQLAPTVVLRLLDLIQPSPTHDEAA